MRCYFFLIVLLLMSSCGDEETGSGCRVVEAFSGYPESFDRPKENISYNHRYEFAYAPTGELVSVTEFSMLTGEPTRTVTDFQRDLNYLLPEGSPDGRYMWTASNDSSIQIFIDMEGGNATREGIALTSDTAVASLTGRNYFDDRPNVLNLDAIRALMPGRGGLAALNSKNNLVAWADLQGSGLYLEYDFEFDSRGNLTRTNIPSGLIFDFKYQCR